MPQAHTIILLVVKVIATLFQSMYVSVEKELVAQSAFEEFGNFVEKG